MVSEERIKTNLLLTDYLDYWDELSVKSINDEWTLRYYNYLMNQLNQQINEAIEWLDTEGAKEFFFGEAEQEKEIFAELESQWERILNSKYETIDDLLEEVYKYGKIKGYQKIAETLRYSKTDKLALTHVRNYNFNLIQKLDGELRQAIKNRIFQAVISGENPRSFANKLVDLGLERLPNSTFTPQQRAVMIARTEVARAQNTGILQSYVNECYTQVKILTAEDDNVCYLCLRNAYEFNEGEDVIFANRGEERIHNIKDLIEKKNWVPLHPNCRCTYLSIWKSKGNCEGEKYVVNLTERHINWSFQYKGTEYTFQGNTSLSRQKFLEKYGLDISKLDVESRAFIKIYTDDGVDPINKFLRKEITEEEAKEKWDTISKQLVRDGKLHYHLPFEKALKIKESIFEKYGKTLDEDIIVCRREKKRYMKPKEDGTYHYDAFTSTSIYEYANEHLYGKEINYILIPKGTKILYLEEITNVKGDYEILFPPGINLNHVKDLSKHKKVWELA